MTTTRKKLVEVVSPLEAINRASARRYSARTIKMLWGRSAGRCAIPECRVELLVGDAEHDPIVVIGDIAHIEASSDAGPRGNRSKSKQTRDDYDNLILLCKNCHARMDGQKRKFTLGSVQKIKADHETWVRASLPERGLSRTGWTVAVLQGEQPIDVQKAVNALRPDYSDGPPHIIEVRRSQEDWEIIRETIVLSVQKMMGPDQLSTDRFNQRFCVFPLAPVTACVTFGFELTDRPRVRLFQYHRHKQSWEWDDSYPAASEASIIGLPGKINRKHGEVVVCVEISSLIQKNHLRCVGHNIIGTVRLRVPHPSVSWLRASDQLESIGKAASEMFEHILNQFPNATSWHLLAATPAPAAVRIGQAMNPTMVPSVQLYEFRRTATPAYTASVRLGVGSK